MQNKDIILRLLLEKSPSTRAELIKKSGIDTANVGVYLKRLIKDGHAQKIRHGLYTITEEGKKVAEIFSFAERTSKKLIKEIFEPSDDIDLENTQTIIKLKQRYGKEKLLKIIDDIKALIE